MRKRIKLIANPVSGGDARLRIETARRCLEQAGAEVALYLTGKRGDAGEVAARLQPADFDLVVAAGGDGTLNEVANGLVGRGIPLAFLPLGTANVMALEMDIPFAIEAACAIALHGVAKPVNLGRIADHYFLMMAGIGFDAATVRAVSSRLKRHTGKFAYLIAALRTLITRPTGALQLTTAEGETLIAYHAIVSNIRLYGGRFVMAPGSGLDTGQLTACLVERSGRLPLLLFWLRILLRGRLLGPVKRIDSTGFQCSGATVPVQIDGDDFGDIPVTITCLSGQLELIFPDPD